MSKIINLQDIILNQVRKDHTPINIFLVNGFQLKGVVKGFDNYTLVLETDGKQQLVYKHAISTLIPQKPVNFNAAEKPVVGV
ncbi:MAG: RNA chaperone Hfq [Clostridiales bacterium]|nr:RNA chaperone Hfq [Clostridiales bacterium]